MRNATNAGLDWLIDDLVNRVASVRSAVLLATDGLLIAGSTGLARADAEHLSAIGSAYRSLATGVGNHFDLGPARQTVVELGRAYLLVTEAGPRASLVLIADEDADLGLVAYEMNHVVLQAGPHLSVEARTAPVGGGQRTQG
ncbi:roadblock/LC7 domain-containing protein [Nocardia sp. NPDC058658]|uniref:roadblock/LC7 domain-containing protein n=1 Tax=Nocardia sp. NPDC058658 TaxID=3346580 RepID=UPI0036498796